MARFTGSATQRTTAPITVAAPNRLGGVWERTAEPFTIAAPNRVGAVFMRTMFEMPLPRFWSYWDGAVEHPATITFWYRGAERDLIYDGVTST